MREIKNNVEIGKAQRSGLRQGKAEQSDLQFGAELEEADVKDFSNPTEILGRSQVNKADNLKEDVAFGMENPQKIQSADKFFEVAYAQLSKNKDPYAYEKASYMASIYAQELL